MAHSLGTPLGAEWKGTRVSRARSWEIQFLFGASASGFQPEGKAMIFSVCSGIVLGTPCHMVKHMNSAASLHRFES